MDILAAIDSFKGSASSFELNQAFLDGWLTDGKKTNVPIADGGEGTAEALYHSLGGVWKKNEGIDLLFRKHESRYLLTDWREKKIAVIESAEVIGIDLLDKPTNQTIRLASSYALGELIKAVLAEKPEQIIITLGGSGCSDGGLGLLQSLGASLEGVTEGNPLLSVEEVHLNNCQEIFAGIEVIIAADVTSPYSGKKGAARQFGRQKGGTEETLGFLDQQAKKIADQIKRETTIDLDEIPGSGAAGGIGGALFLLGAQMRSGFELVSQMIGLEEQVKQADIVVTGEGRIDEQTIHGKVPYGIAVLAKKYQKPIIAICGSREKELGELTCFLPVVFSIQLRPANLEEAMDHQRTLENTKVLAQTLSQLLSNDSLY
ncbi:glycerate kinase [Enterococcus sp. ZJ1668]|uniref:glycerate kinase family protein n=1 Tax=Enterococcus sp. ZJ1668 TaxID=2709402 RepID=UPI0013EE0689|nr:glycerate kinase [Enterococcus sp. ZJ1668]